MGKMMTRLLGAGTPMEAQVVEDREASASQVRVWLEIDDVESITGQRLR